MIGQAEHEVPPWSYRLGGVTVSVRFRSPEGVPDIDPFPLQRAPAYGPADFVLEVREEGPGWEILRDGECLSTAMTRAELLGAFEWCVTTSVLQWRRKDRLVLHAATLGTSAQRGHLLIVGPHGAGKTTLALALQRNTPCVLYGDDVALLDPTTGYVEAFPRPLYWKSSEDPPVGPAHDAGGLRLLPTSVLSPRCPPAPCGVIVFPCRRPGQGPEIQRVGDGETLTRLAVASLLRGSAAFDATVRLVRASSHWLALYDDAADIVGPLVEVVG